MNEAQILQQQLAGERSRFVAAARACGGMSAAARAAHPEFMAACAEYLAFAATRLDAQPRAQTLSRLKAARAAGTDSEPLWHDFFAFFQAALRRRFDALEEVMRGPVRVAQLRALIPIDADSIVEERAHRERVLATVPPGLAPVLAPALAAAVAPGIAAALAPGMAAGRVPGEAS